MAVYTISICWYDVSSVSPLMGIPCLHLLSLDTVSHHMTLEGLLILKIHRGFTLVFYRFFTLSHPVGGALFHPHLPEIKVFQLFVRTIPVIGWLMCSVCLCFCSGFDCIIILKFCLYCVLSCVCMYYYVSWL